MRATTFHTIYIGFRVKFSKNGCIYEFLSEKKPKLKKNCLKWSLGSQVICILKSTIFRFFFFANDRMIFLIFVASGGEFLKTNGISKFLSQFHPI
jgi:hypothetical protein